MAYQPRTFGNATNRPFADRREAGRELASKLATYRNRQDVVVLALPRGGVPVGFEIAEALDARLDIFVVRKLGMPGHPEFGIGAIASGGVRIVNDEVIRWYGVRENEIEAVARQELAELHRREREYRQGRTLTDLRDRTIILVDYFFAEQNARLVRDAEEYYRAMFGGRVESWNLRDTHMMETLDALLAHTRRSSGHARAVIWAHNSHLGDARATQMGESGELNLGQLTRQAYGTQARLIGFTTHTGTVTAASDWDEPAQRKRVRPSLAGSYERLFHDVGVAQFHLQLGDAMTHEALSAPRLERAIGVIHRPDTERQSHYFRARLPQQFDTILHIDETRALEPLEPWSRDEADLPETYPSAL